MAIASGRVKTKSLTNLLDKAFLTTTDRTKDTLPSTDAQKLISSVTSKAATAIGKSNIFDTARVPGAGSALTAIGIIPGDGNPACPINENNLPKNQDNRLINSPTTSSGCVTTNSTHLVAKSVLSELASGLPEVKIAALENMVKDGVNTFMSGISLPQIDKSSALVNGMKSMVSILSVVGGTLKEKSDTLRLLRCVNKSGGNTALSTAINRSVLNDSLTQSLCMSKERLGISMAKLISSGTATTADVISVTLSVLKSSGANTSEYATGLSVIRSLTPGLASNEVAKLKASTGNLTSGISGLDTKTTNPSRDYNDMVSTLDGVLPGWQNTISGGTSASLLKNNKYAADMAGRLLRSSVVTASQVTSTPTAISAADPGYLAKLITAANQRTVAVI